MPFEIAIFGAGPIGQALALLLASRARQPERIALIDRHGDDRADDPRVIALSASSLLLLGRIIDLSALPHAPIRTVQVSQRGHLGRTTMTAREQGVEALGWVVRLSALMKLLQAATRRSGVTHQRLDGLPSLQRIDDAIIWAGGEAAFGVQAEGGWDSMLDPHAAAIQHDYQQTATICELRFDRPAQDIAYERFTASGPIALLPLPAEAIAGGRRYGLVWCEPHDAAAATAQLDDASFISKLAPLLNRRIGKLDAVTPRQAYPLRLVRSPQVDHQRWLRIGNAAQMLHPVAGQGLNLGLRDAYALSEAIAAHADWPARIAAFQRARRIDRTMTIGLTDALARWFVSSGPLGRHAAGLGLLTLDLVPPLRQAFARQMMFGNLAQLVPQP